MKFSTLPYAVQLIIYTVLFAAITKIGLMFSLVPSDVTQIWSPAGLSIVVLYAAGPRFLPAVFFGIGINYILLYSSGPLGIALAIGSTMEAYVGYTLLKRTSFKSTLRTLRDIGILIFVSGAISTLLNAFFSVAAAGFFRPELKEHFLSNVAIWWMGNLVGLIVIAPLAIVIIDRRFERLEKKKIAEIFAMIIIVYAGSQAVFHGNYFPTQLNYSLAFILFPFAIWGTIRFGIVGSVMTTFIISLNATLSSQTGLGLFAAESYSLSIILIDAFIIVLGSTSLALAALIEERQTAEQVVRRSESRYRIVTERTGQLVYDYDIITGAILWSGAIQAVTQFTSEEFSRVGVDQWADLIHPDDRTDVESELSASMIQHREFNVEYRFRKKDGSYIDILDRGAFLYKDHDKTTAYRMLGTMADVSHINETLKKQKESEERFRFLIEKSADGIMLLDKRGNIIFVSSSATAIIGYLPEELTGKSIFHILHPAEAKKYIFKFGRLRAEPERSEYMLGRFKHKNGEWVYIEGMVTNLFNHPSVNAYVANFRNGTERIKAEVDLKRSLQEKEILLKEVHHRVKNNMQVISSLLNLQSASVNDTETLALFRESQNRVHSMALVHEILYQSHDIASVHLPTYGKQLVASLRKSFAASTGTISISVKITDIVLDIDEAIPCGLIINELVSNALKHAFPKNRKGKVVIEVKQNRTSMIQLSVRDNGIGLPSRKTKSETLGLKLVHALAEQLKGSVTITVKQGTAFIVEFPRHGSSTTAAV